MDELTEPTELTKYKQKLDQLNNKRLDAILNLNSIENEINLLKWTFIKNCQHEYEPIQSIHNNCKKCKYCGNLI